jgi:AmmeMemoRadiSam system protein A
MMGIDGHGLALAQWARDRLKQELGGPLAVPPTGDWANEPGATFVTLRWRDGTLQGCIGSLEPRRSIVNDVAHNAIAAGLHDPRSNPVGLKDVDDLEVELSILSPLERITFADQPAALRAIRPGLDGIVFEHHGRRATFLPSMWPRLPEVREFLGELKEKAGFPHDFWDDDVRLYRYTVEKHHA